MTKTEFNLDERVTLVPVSGKTDVVIKSDGKYDIYYKHDNGGKGPRYVTKLTNGVTSLITSRKGAVTYLKIRLESGGANAKRFQEEFKKFMKYYFESENK